MDQINGKIVEDSQDEIDIGELLAYLKTKWIALVAALLVGYGGDINFSMGVSMDGTVTGVEMLSLSETAGLGMRAKDEEFKGQFAGKTVDQFVVTKNGASAENEIDAISGATFTSKAVTNGVNAGLRFYESLKEGGILQ